MTRPTRYRWTLSAAFNGPSKGAYRDQLRTIEVTGPATPAGAIIKAIDWYINTSQQNTIRYIQINRKEALQ